MDEQQAGYFSKNASILPVLPVEPSVVGSVEKSLVLEKKCWCELAWEFGMEVDIKFLRANSTSGDLPPATNTERGASWRGGPPCVEYIL